LGVKGLAPLGCLPLWGREGVTLAISTPAQKTRGDFNRAIFLKEYCSNDDLKKGLFFKKMEKKIYFTFNSSITG
jgi:hypothetical protein